VDRPDPKVLSYGGGLDSFAMLLDALARGEKPDVVAFVDVADPEHLDPGEWPSTYRHIEEVVMPLCEREGIEFVTVDSTRYPVRDARSLFAWLKARKQIPVAGPNRICTVIAKVERFEAWMADRFPQQLVEVWIGFEAGEEARAAKDPNAGKASATRRNRFPLMEAGLCRCRCEALVIAAGYPVPRKSACEFCPYGTKGDWQTLAREEPARFSEIGQLETDKPLTKNGKKLSIMGYRTLKDRDGNPTGKYKAPPLAEFIKGTYKRKLKPCLVCGAADRATKAMGCSYVAEAQPAKEVA
jgi:hypothetical protein